MKILDKAIHDQGIRLEMAIKHNIDVEYHRGYLKALKDVSNGSIRSLSKLDNVMREQCVSDTEVAREVGQSRQSIFDKRLKGIKNKTAKVEKIAEYLKVNVEDILEIK